ncbi:unnamed protein product [Musa acuminata subsp. malaccensis]|uniref:(wild Malaysian banana) hypothetical protein n=1 Tax=Musa acuminata subsp. malaccensis TaxID=214687 RepID=A0A8D6ZZE6_MUSAM|nr:unnamed protein product [Musa acuminata subsp. malaccensis]
MQRSRGIDAVNQLKTVWLLSESRNCVCSKFGGCSHSHCLRVLAYILRLLRYLPSLKTIPIPVSQRIIIRVILSKAFKITYRNINGAYFERQTLLWSQQITSSMMNMYDSFACSTVFLKNFHLNNREH